jgi:23S rRNA (guanosine2251-2'-O)-methyltransferase
MKKPVWVIEKEQAKRAAAAETVWLFGLHAVRDALMNPARTRLRLIVTQNAHAKLADAIAASGMEPEVVDPRRFTAPIDPQSVHQGAALEVKPLDWGSLADIALGEGPEPARIVMLDRVTDPHNVGAILRSAEVFGARAVVGVQRYSAPETGALAKTASGALERQPYLRLRNLADAMGGTQGDGLYRVGPCRRGRVDDRRGAGGPHGPACRPCHGVRRPRFARPHPRHLHRAGENQRGGRIWVAQRLECGGGGLICGPTPGLIPRGPEEAPCRA